MDVVKNPKNKNFNEIKNYFSQPMYPLPPTNSYKAFVFIFLLPESFYQTTIDFCIYNILLYKVRNQSKMQ